MRHPSVRLLTPLTTSSAPSIRYRGVDGSDSVVAIHLSAAGTSRTRPKPCPSGHRPVTGVPRGTVPSGMENESGTGRWRSKDPPNAEPLRASNRAARLRDTGALPAPAGSAGSVFAAVPWRYRMVMARSTLPPQFGAEHGPPAHSRAPTVSVTTSASVVLPSGWLAAAQCITVSVARHAVSDDEMSAKVKLRARRANSSHAPIGLARSSETAVQPSSSANTAPKRSAPCATSNPLSILRGRSFPLGQPVAITVASRQRTMRDRMRRKLCTPRA